MGRHESRLSGWRDPLDFFWPSDGKQNKDYPVFEVKYRETHVTNSARMATLTCKYYTEWEEAKTVVKKGKGPRGRAQPQKTVEAKWNKESEETAQPQCFCHDDPHDKKKDQRNEIACAGYWYNAAEFYKNLARAYQVVNSTS